MEITFHMSGIYETSFESNEVNKIFEIFKEVLFVPTRTRVCYK